MPAQINEAFVASTTQLDKHSNRSSIVSDANVENCIESEKAETIWNEHKKVIVICIVFVVVVLLVGGALSYIFWPKSETDLKFHKNYSKFSRESCTVNHSVNIKDDFSLLKFPWLVRILRNNRTEEAHSCTATLIANDLLLTAAHCLNEDENSTISSIILSGTFGDNFNKRIPRKYLKLIQHKDYVNNDDETADIGLIKLSQPLSFSSSFYPVCLPFENHVLPQDLSIVQWGDRNVASTNIKETKIAVMNSDECQIKYNNIKYEEYEEYEEEREIKFYKDNKRILFCVELNATNSLVGESGSPAVLSDKDGVTLHGVLKSGGIISNVPDLYLIPQAHFKWILDNA